MNILRVYRENGQNLQEVSITSEAIENYAALIIQKDNPHFESIISDFNNAIELLQDKPEN